MYKDSHKVTITTLILSSGVLADPCIAGFTSSLGDGGSKDPYASRQVQTHSHPSEEIFLQSSS